MILFFDTETSGLHPGEICQLSYVMEDEKTVRAKNIFFAARDVEYSAYMVHGFSVEKLRLLSGGKTFGDKIEEIEDDFLSADVVVSHNFSFDAMFMRKEFERRNKVFAVKNDFCSMKKATPLCKLRRRTGAGYKYPKLSEFCAHFGIDDDYINAVCKRLYGQEVGFHDARFDTVAMYLAVKRAMNESLDFAILKEFI